MTRIVLLALVVGACSAPPTVAPSVPVTSAPADAEPSNPATTSRPVDTGDLADAVVAEATVDGRPLLVAVASTPEQRSRGLRGVSNLGDLDGMLFTWAGDTVSSSFTMADTVIPLDIAFFDLQGAFVDGFTMVPCTAAPCASYRASGDYAYALEVPAGSQPGIGPGSVFSGPG
ncbi:MAG TPA: DUF192 domain-containing protein [Acidimicrobiia bacterium]|nr:DUF192 domain-containing protein [Acidimicrobiia bacterium]